ncbi:putative major capsid protein [Mycobacterium phage PR]|nr:putative major capsid protein [Mycobacterium phage PR]
MKFTMPTPDELAEMSASDLNQRAAQAAAEIAVFQARYNAGDEFTPEEVERFEYLAESHESLTATATELESAETQASEKLSDLMARTTAAAKPADPAPAADEAPAETPAETPADDAPEGGAEVVAEAEAAAAEAAAATPVAAAARSVSFAAGANSTPPPAPKDESKPWALLPSAPNFAKHAGQGVDLHDIAMAIASVDPSSGQGVQQTGTAGQGMAKQAIASITRPQVTMEANSEQVIYEYLQNLGKEIPGHGAATAEALVAAGGWCAPSQQVYTFCDVPPASGLISLPDFPFDLSRGGVRVPVNPDISQLLESLWHYTESQLEAVDGSGNPTAVKPIIELPCPDEFIEWRLEAIGWAAKAGILQRQAWPEAIENALQQIQVAHQHRVSQLTIGKMVAGSGAPKVVPTDAILGATSSVLNGLARNAVNLRIDKGLAETATIEGVAPIWFREVLRADLALRDGKEMLAVTNAEIDSWLAVRNIYLQYVTDWQKGEVGQPGDLDSQEWPGFADVLLYPAGTWFRQLANVITLGVQYPLEQLQLNQYTHIFTEDSFQVGKRCNESIQVRVPLCVNGAVGAREQITCTYTGVATKTATITTTGSPTGGNFTLKFSANDIESATIAYNAAAATIDTTLTAIDDGVTGAGDITASGGALPTAVVVTYPAELGDLEKGTVALTGGSDPDVNVVVS